MYIYVEEQRAVLAGRAAVYIASERWSIPSLYRLSFGYSGNAKGELQISLIRRRMCASIIKIILLASESHKPLIARAGKKG